MSTDTLALPLDRARAKLFTSALKVGALRAILLEKRRRIPALLGLHAAMALVASVLAPTLLLVLGPLLLGVPHLVADLRYLVLRPRFTRGLRAALLGGSLLLLAVRVLHELGVSGMLAWEPVAASALIVAACALAARGQEPWRVAVGSCVAFGLAAASWRWPRGSRLALAHGHNLVVLGLWAFGFARQRSRAALLALACVATAASLLVTPLAWYGFEFGLQQSFGLHSLNAADVLAPGVVDVVAALGVVASFAFLQSLHYAVWLHAVPQEETRGEATLSFRMSLRQLRSELGAGGLVAATLLALALPVSALVGSAAGAKELYLSLSSFHAYLEVAAALAFFELRARPSTVALSASSCCR